MKLNYSLLSLSFYCLSLILVGMPLKAHDSLKVSPATTLVSDTAPLAEQSVFQFLTTTTVQKMVLSTDFGQLLENRNKDEYQKAKLFYTDANGEEVKAKVKVKVRGKSRRRICDFPPIKLKFSKSDLGENGLNQEFNTLKLVTHCSNDKEAQQNLLKEYLAYRLYNQLTPASFKVKLVEIEYRDSENDKSFTRYGFLIENTDEMAVRLNGKTYEEYGVLGKNLDAQQYQLFSLFQYMIGNTDWELKMNHNTKFVQCNSTGQLTAIPYDFDFSGLVNNTYAKPNPNFKGIATVRDRIFMGDCENPEALAAVVELMKENKEALMAEVMNFDLLSKRNRRDIMSFLKSFFKQVEASEEAPKTIIANNK